MLLQTEQNYLVRMILHKNRSTFKQMFNIPQKARENACRSILNLRAGGTQTGINRAKQLCNNRMIDSQSVNEITNWWARHGPNASNGGTSYPGFEKWQNKCEDPVHLKGCPDLRSGKHRGAVAVLRWGGPSMFNALRI